MKWSITGLLVLGLLAALCATVLVSSLVATADAGPNEAQPPGEVEVLVARQALPAMSVIDASMVTVERVSLADAPSGHLSSAVQAVGRVLAVPMVEGQPFTRGAFVREGSGLELAAALPEGMRAVSLSLPNDSGLAGLVGPGAVVDVIAAFPVHEQDRRREAVSTLLLQGVQVLGVEHRTVVSRGLETEAVANPLDSGRRLVVTLMVDPRQAKALQLAMQYGEVSLAMRNPLDATEPEPGVIALSDLAVVRERGLAAADVAKMFEQSQGQMIESLERLVSHRSGSATADRAAPEAQAAKQAYWQTVIIRGHKSEERLFPISEARP